MPTKEETMFQVAHQMLKSGKVGKVKANKKQIFNFFQQHKIHISWAVDNLPYVSAAVAAVVVKGLIKYDKDRIGEFCKALKSGFFTGKKDPVYLLWKFLQSHKGKNTELVYRKTVCAIRAYAIKKDLFGLTPAESDIFNWDEDLNVPDDLLTQWEPERVPNISNDVSVKTNSEETNV